MNGSDTNTRKEVSRVWLELLIYECSVFQTSAGTRTIVHKFTKSDTPRETLFEE